MEKMRRRGPPRSSRPEKKLSWEQWGKRLHRYIEYINGLINPDLIILGGGISDKFDKFIPYIKVNTKIVPAELRNQAGIVGAAIAAGEFLE